MCVDSLRGKLTGITRRGNQKILTVDNGNTLEGFAYLADFHLAIGPSWDLNDHVQDRLGVVGIEGDIVEGGDRDAILLDVDAVLQSVGSGNLSDLVLGGHVCVVVRSDFFVGRQGA